MPVEAVMGILVWLGALVSFIGLIGLVWCIVIVWKAKSSGKSDDELKASIQKVMPLNSGALFLSVIGLIMVVMGIVFS